MFVFAENVPLKLGNNIVKLPLGTKILDISQNILEETGEGFSFYNITCLGDVNAERVDRRIYCCLEGAEVPSKCEFINSSRSNYGYTKKVFLFENTESVEKTPDPPKEEGVDEWTPFIEKYGELYSEETGNGPKTKKGSVRVDFQEWITTNNLAI